MTHYKGNQQPPANQPPKQINQGGAKEMGGSQEGGQQKFGKEAEDLASKTKMQQKDE
jgi:hypothetical protein